MPFHAFSAGIQWDDSTRGKNDGSVNKDGTEHRYFTCPQGAGSFLKVPLVQTGHSLLTALEAKYAAPPSIQDDSGESKEEADAPGMHIIFVGDSHIRERQQLGKLFNVSVKAGLVSSVPEEGTLGKECPHLIDLDMRENLLWNVRFMAGLGAQLGKLETLNVGGNALLAPSPEDAASIAGALPSLRVLVLSATGLQWPAIQALSPAVPNLQELHVCDNGLAQLAPPPPAAAAASAAGDAPPAPFANVSTLTLNGNDLPWEEVLHLGSWPALRSLHLVRNAVAAVSACPAGAFPLLEALTLTGNPITAWSSVDALGSFPALSWLRASELPLFDAAGMGASVARMHVIARVGALRSLNGSQVRDRERADAEKVYLKHASEEITQHAQAGTIQELFPGLVPSDGSAPSEPAAANHSGAEAFAAETHPRFQALSALYAEALPSAGDSSGGATLASNIVHITLRSMAGASSFMPPVPKALPLTLPVQALAQIAAKVFEMEDAALLRLSFRDSANAFPTLMDNELKPLSYFGVCEGGEVLIEEVDAAEGARQAAEAAAAAAQREAAQGAVGNALVAAAAQR